MKPIHPMPKKTRPVTPPPCGCSNCLCHRDLRCRCHDYNALLALVLWDLGRSLRRQPSQR